MQLDGRALGSQLRAPAAVVGAEVGTGAEVGDAVGAWVGAPVGAPVGASEGDAVGAPVGDNVGASVKPWAGQPLSMAHRMHLPTSEATNELQQAARAAGQVLQVWGEQ